MSEIKDSFRREKGSLYSLVTKYYIFFAAVVLILTFVVVTLTNNILDNASYEPNAGNIIDQMSLLESEKYDKIRLESYVGTNGYIEVLDENANILYSSKPSISNTYNAEELEYIPKLSGNTYYALDVISKSNGSSGYVLGKYSYITEPDDEDDPGIYFGLVEVTVLDEDRNVVYSSNDSEDKLTEQELSYITGGDDENVYMQLYDFYNKNGEKRYLIMHADYSTNSVDMLYRRIYMTAILIFFTIFAVSIVYFVVRTAVAVRKPMNMLQDAMAELGTGKRDIAISYSGPKEFVQIIDTFNEMTEKLQKSEEERAHLEAERQKMLADISHDLKTPITVIQGYSKAVSDGLVPEAEKKKYLDTITLKADSLAELINTFYEYSKLEHPEFQLVRSNGDICEYFREYLAMKYEELEISGFPLEIDIPEEKIARSFDESQLKRVFENIISNSLKSNPAGTTIYAGMKQVGNKVAIYLGDDGVGIPSAIRDEIFKPFVVGNDARTSGTGTGLGLSIAKLIVEAHDGTIRLMGPEETKYTTMFEIII